MARFIGRMQDACWTHWKEDYLCKAQSATAKQNKPQTILSVFLQPTLTSQSSDEFEAYCNQALTAGDSNIIHFRAGTTNSLSTTLRLDISTRGVLVTEIGRAS